MHSSDFEVDVSSPEKKTPATLSTFLGVDKWVFPKIRVPQNGWFIMENPIKIDDLGVPYFWKHPNHLQKNGICVCPLNHWHDPAPLPLPRNFGGVWLGGWGINSGGVWIE